MDSCETSKIQLVKIYETEIMAYYIGLTYYIVWTKYLNQYLFQNFMLNVNYKKKFKMCPHVWPYSVKIRLYKIINRNI